MLKNVNVTRVSFLDPIQWIQCPLWITTKCIPDSPCSFTSVRLLVFVPVSPTFLLTALVKWKKEKIKKEPKSTFSYSSGAVCGHACSGAIWKSPPPLRLLPHEARKDAVNRLFYFREREGYRRNLAVIFGSLISLSPSCFAEWCTFWAAQMHLYRRKVLKNKA